MSQTYRLHVRPAVVSRAPTFSENFESGPSRRCRVPRESTSSEEQMEIDAFWRGGARPALQPNGGRNLFQKNLGLGWGCEGELGQAHPPPSHGLGAAWGDWPTLRPVMGWAQAAEAAWGWPTPAYPAHMSATRVCGDSWAFIYLLVQTFLHNVSGVIGCLHDVSMGHHALQFY
jgi:hypothetical protein